MAGLMTFWDGVLQKCAGKGQCSPKSSSSSQCRSPTRPGAYYELQRRMIEVDMRDIEAPSNSDRPSVRFLDSGEASPVSSVNLTPSHPTFADGAWESQLFEAPHARVQDILEDRRQRPTRIPEPTANLCSTQYSTFTAAGLIASPFDPCFRKDRIQMLAPKCSLKKFNSENPFFRPAGQEKSKYADCAPGRVGEEARARKRELGEAKARVPGIDPNFFAELKQWLKYDFPTLKLPDVPAEDPNVVKERESEAAFFRRRAKNAPRPPMHEYIDEHGTVVQVGFGSYHKEPLQPLTNRELEDMQKLSSSARRISVEGLNALAPVDEAHILQTPPSTVPSHMKRQQVRRHLKYTGYPQNQRVMNPKRSQSSHVLMLRKNARGPQVPTGRHLQPQRRITLAETREQAENAIESDEDDLIEEDQNTTKATAAKKGAEIGTVEEAEDDGNEEFSDIEEEGDEGAFKQANERKLTVNRLVAGDFTPEGRARHEMEKRWEERRRKSRGSQRTLVEHYPKVVSNKHKETVPISIPYRPTKLINQDGLVVTFKA